MKNAPYLQIRFGVYSLRFRRRSLFLSLFLFTMLVLLLGLHIASGSYHLGYKDIWLTMTGHSHDITLQNILWRLRLPRAVTAIFVGASLGMAGAVFQSITRNPLGSPDILGFTTGAATGAIMQIVLFNAGPWPTVIAAIGGGLFTSLCVFSLSFKAGCSFNVYRFVLTGIGVGALLSGINTVLLVMGDLDQAANAQLWLSGSLNTRTPQHAFMAGVVFFIAAPFILWQSRQLGLMELGDDIALQLGCQVAKTRIKTIVAAVILTAGATAAAGPVAFIALAAPQLARKLTKAAQTALIASALIGALLLVLADLLTLHMAAHFKMPIGLLTGLLGGLYLLWLLKNKR